MNAPSHTPAVESSAGAFIAGLLGRLPACALRPNEVVPIPAAALPPRAASLLAHDRHMTAELEAHFAAGVAVHVLDRVHAGERYAREILLSVPGGRVVQYAVVDVALGQCPPALREDIVAERVPLGRALLASAEDWDVEAAGFVRVGVPPALAARFGCAVQAAGYGRLLRIRHGAQKLVEGLELLTPALA
ncbi:MAG TPA: hypothetical protein PJ986_15185 [Gammaproteobacteria bacterium]|nr:hypothetical protein [Gammaproteobacteria bacterium]